MILIGLICSVTLPVAVICDRHPHVFFSSFSFSSRAEASKALRASFTSCLQSGGILLQGEWRGSVAAESCDHCGASASSCLMELGDLQGDVYQWCQHHLHTTQTQTIGLLISWQQSLAQEHRGLSTVSWIQTNLAEMCSIWNLLTS